jgi:single-strand DNA-binding protein
VSSLNKVMLIGNLGKDPEIKELDGGKIFAKLSLATNEKYKGESKTTWHNIVVWDEKKAEILEQYCVKGSKLYVEGKLEMRKWTDKDDIERYAYEVVVGSFEGMIRLLDSRKDSEDREERSERRERPAERSTTRSKAADPKRTKKRDEDDRARRAYEDTRELDDEVPF